MAAGTILYTDQLVAAAHRFTAYCQHQKEEERFAFVSPAAEDILFFTEMCLFSLTQW